MVDEIEQSILRRFSQQDIGTDTSMRDFFESYLLGDNELEWIDPAETGDLTSAPMLGLRDDGCYRPAQEGKVIERWAFMDYQVRSVLEDLRDPGKVVFVS